MAIHFDEADYYKLRAALAEHGQRVAHLEKQIAASEHLTRAVVRDLARKYEFSPDATEFSWDDDRIVTVVK
jgi:hypothetical protein